MTKKYNLMDDDILEYSKVLADALKRNWTVEIVFLTNNHHMRYKYVVTVHINHEKTQVNYNDSTSAYLILV
nr:hypothetical protein [Listeria immobilis]